MSAYRAPTSVFAAADRWLPCDNCGLGIQTPVAGGTTQCTRCQAPFVAYARPNTAMQKSPATDEMARRARLRVQDGRPLLPPPGIEQLVQGGLQPHRMQEARMIWSATRKALGANASDIGAAERLLFLTIVMRNTMLDNPTDEPSVRALIEGALEVFFLPRHKQSMLGYLARGAAKAGDMDSAEAWIAQCDPFSEDLLADSSYRVTRAFMDTGKGNFANVLQVLGGNEADVPIDDSMDPIAAVLRANAWEKTNNLQAAQMVLTQYMARHGNASTIQSITSSMPAQWQVCAQSAGSAQQQVRQVVAQRAASSGGGSMIGWIFLLSGFAPVLIIGTLWLTTPKFPIETTFFVLIFPIVFGAVGISFIRSAARKKEIAQNGLRGRGRIVGISPTGTRINGVPLMKIDVEVHVDNHPPRMASTKRLGYQQVAPGTEVQIIWSPKYPNEIVFE